jgi:hypothetical protein
MNCPQESPISLFSARRTVSQKSRIDSVTAGVVDVLEQLRLRLEKLGCMTNVWLEVLDKFELVF